MTDGLPRAEVARRLDAVEAEHDVRVVYAVESGSRAWGFASQDSDVDVRFLYVHRPEWYLAVDRRRDVIEQPIVDLIDLSGWDLRKALGLLFASNPPLLEWLRSPLVYRETTGVAAGMRGLAAAYYDPKAAAHHYYHMAGRTQRGDLRGDLVRHKKYFYALRPLLARRWIETERSAPPMDVESLADRCLPAGPIRAEVEGLLAAKRAGVEADAGPRLPAIHAFVDGEIDRLGGVRVDPRPQASVEPLNAFFRAALREVWP